MLRKLVSFLLCLCLFLSLSPTVRGTEAMAENISNVSLISGYEGFKHRQSLFDGDLAAAYPVKEEASLTLTYGDGIGSVYILFDKPCGEYTVTNEATGKEAALGKYGYLHDFTDLTALFGGAPASVTLRFPEGCAIAELFVFGPGETPDFVQKWEPPVEGKADLVLFSTHGDDEQLFFAGILPYYAGELELNVQVVYLTGHQNSYPNRMREMLNGLYAVGVRAYPVFGPFPDQLSMTKADAYQQFANKGYSREILLEFVVENLRRFRPLVAIGHDIRGEYGHGQHRVYADLLMEAVQIAADPSRFPYSAGRYGLWDTPKTYLHLYKENPIVLDWDRPLSKFGGMTAFEVTRDLGFPCHVSQYYDFLWYLTQARTAAAMWKYSPSKYGLFRSTVGEDVEKNEFFENLEGFRRPPILRKKPLLPPLPGAADRNSLWN